MQLRNLVIVADEENTMALFCKIKGKQYRYNFAKDAWDSNLDIDLEKIISIGDFKKHPLYQKVKTMVLANWSTFDARKLKGLSLHVGRGDIKPKKNMVVNMSIEIS